MPKLVNIDSTAKYKVGQVIPLGLNNMRYRVVEIIDHNTMTVELI